MSSEVFGVIDGWQAWRRDESAESASAYVWIDAQGVSRCTCFGRDVCGDDVANGLPTDCKYTTNFTVSRRN